MRFGQVSAEFLMVTGVALLILTGSAYFLFDYTKGTSEKAALAQAGQIGYRLMDEARNVYIYGHGSFVTVRSNMPQEVRNVYVVDGRSLVIEITSTRGIIPVILFSDVPINGTTVVGSQVRVNQSDQVMHPGRVEFRVESRGTYVEVMQIT